MATYQKNFSFVIHFRIDTWTEERKQYTNIETAVELFFSTVTMRSIMFRNYELWLFCSFHLRQQLSANVAQQNHKSFIWKLWIIMIITIVIIFVALNMKQLDTIHDLIWF